MAFPWDGLSFLVVTFSEMITPQKTGDEVLLTFQHHEPKQLGTLLLQAPKVCKIIIIVIIIIIIIT